MLCSGIHEFGHVLAASRILLPVENIGIAVVFGAPIAFARLQWEEFSDSSLWEQITVHCAGIWHNIILSLSCLLIVKYFFLFISPLFYVGGGVSVFQINKHSELTRYGFATGDHIIINAVGNCTVKDIDAWYSCLKKLEDEPEGLCVPKLMLLDMKFIPKTECDTLPDHVYFSLQGYMLEDGICLDITAVHNYSVCTDGCDNKSLCGIPLKFIVLQRLEYPPIFIDGHPSDLKFDVKVSEYLPRFWFISPSIPETIKEFFEYIVIFSNCFACFNMLPFSGFDGMCIIEKLIEILLFNYYPYHLRELLSNYIATVALGVTVSIIFVTLCKFFIFSL